MSPFWYAVVVECSVTAAVASFCLNSDALMICEIVPGHVVFRHLFVCRGCRSASRGLRRLEMWGKSKRCYLHYCFEIRAFLLEKRNVFKKLKIQVLKFAFFVTVLMLRQVRTGTMTSFFTFTIFENMAGSIAIIQNAV